MQDYQLYSVDALYFFAGAVGTGTGGVTALAFGAAGTAGGAGGCAAVAAVSECD